MRSNFKPRQGAIDPDSPLFRHLWDNQPYCRDAAKEELVVVLRRDRDNAQECQPDFFKVALAMGTVESW